MACSKQAGVAPFLHVIEAATGEKVTQSEWHAIRVLAAEASGEDLSRARVSENEAIYALHYLQWLNAKLIKGDEEMERNHDDAVIAAALDIRAANVTQGTIATINYLSKNGVGETLSLIRGEAPAEYAHNDWANDVYWPNVKPEERKAFAWAVSSPTLRFYLPATDEDGMEKDYADIDAASEVAHAFQSLPLDASDNDVISALSDSQLREYFYLAEDGGSHPAVKLWEYWKTSGPPRNLPLEVQKRMLADRPGVRLALANNDDADVSIIEELAKDPDWDVRRAVAGNKKTSVETMEALMNDENAAVAARARRRVMATSFSEGS